MNRKQDFLFLPSHDHYLRYWESTSPSVDRISDVFRGFGVDPNSNELKLVNLVIDHRNKLHPPSAELYNLSTNSWTLIRNDTVPVNAINLWPQTESHVTNGVCYWLNSIGEVGDPAVRNILCFDFCNNQFRKLKRPPFEILTHLLSIWFNWWRLEDNVGHGGAEKLFLRAFHDF